MGASPTRQPLQPEATGAVMEVTKWLTYPLSHLYGHFGLVRPGRLGHDVPWVKA